SGCNDGLIRIWEPSLGRCTKTLEHLPKVDCLAVSPDGTTLATGGFDWTIKLWNVADGRELRTLRGHRGYITSLMFTPDGQNVVSGSQDKLVKLWEVSSGDCIRTFEGHPTEVAAVTVSRDGHYIASSGGGFNGFVVVIVWDRSLPTWVHRFRTHDQVISAI